MRIGIIGEGDLARTLQFRCAAADHEVVVAGLPSMEPFDDDARNRGIVETTVDDAARSTDLVVIAIPFGRHTELPPPPFEDRVTVDATDYFAPRDGPIRAIDETVLTSSEVLARHLSGTRLVKAFNTFNLLTLGAVGLLSGDVESPALPIAGDDGGAKLVVTGLVVDLGFTPLDVGTLADSWRLQPGMPVYGMVASPDELRAVLMVP
ncbi:MAG: 8-hydroxy-5-deazaflavin:NADPH oxidoreductase [Acidimicrobiia bacterium]|jgi:predicted dinucleotide-binding enzyme|nr:8-hydroxy-5-deazaflavin:NADPH oxidoreductase [Acidimicrobiia bacterium]